MAVRLFLLLFLTGNVFAKKPPDVNCLVEHLKYVKCSWNDQGTPEVDYTFYSKFSDKVFRSCNTYVSENNVIVGCMQPYTKGERFQTFYTRLVHNNETFEQTHYLKNKVLMYPPVNLTIQMESDSNLWIYWNQTAKDCVESEVHLRTNNNWEISKISTGMQSFCINLPNSNSQYEAEVRSRLGHSCGESLFWSNWSEPVVWGSNNSTG